MDKCKKCGFSLEDHALLEFVRKMGIDNKIVPSPCDKYEDDLK